jgi:hypothetical protein
MNTLIWIFENLRGIGFPIGWMFGMLIQLILFPLFLEKFKADASWWTPQLIGLTITFIIVGVLNRKIVVPWFKKTLSLFILWIKKQLNYFIIWLKK